MPNLNLLSIYRKDPVPAPGEIADIIATREISQLSAGEIKVRFDDLIDKLQNDAYEYYLFMEKQKGIQAMRNFLFSLRNNCHIDNTDDMINLTAEQFGHLNKFFLSLSQSRRARAGSTFEYFIDVLFEKLEYPYTRRPIINGEPDFLLPSIEHFRDFPADCIIFTAKRTLRERWRQIISEGTRGLGFYLATIDDKLTSSQLNQMIENRIYVVVPSRLKLSKYQNNRNVLSFKDFFDLHLDQAMRRWKRNGII